MSGKAEILNHPRWRTLVPVGVILLIVLVCPLLAKGCENKEVAWRKAVKQETGSIRVSFPPGVARMSITLHPLSRETKVILAPGEAGIEAFWLKPGLSTPAVQPASSAKEQKSDGAKKPNGVEKAKDEAPRDPPLPPWLACNAAEQKPKGWVASCKLEDGVLTLERSSSDARSDVWILPVKEVATLRAMPQSELWWTETKLWVGEDQRIALASDCRGPDSEQSQKAGLNACYLARAIFGETALERTTSTTRMIAGKIEKWERDHGAALLWMMVVALGATGLAAFGALVWTVVAAISGRANPPHAEAARLYREMRWPLQWAEVVFPAVAFTLTTASLIVAFRKPQGAEGEAAFREGIGFALVATALGLVSRVLAHTADRLLENAAHHGADRDGIIVPGAPEKKAEQAAPPPASGRQPMAAATGKGGV